MPSTTSSAVPAHSEVSSEPTDILNNVESLRQTDLSPPSSTPLEMSNLDSQTRPDSNAVPTSPLNFNPTALPLDNETQHQTRPGASSPSLPTIAQPAGARDPLSSSIPVDETSNFAPPPPALLRERQYSTAIGPPTDQPIIPMKEPESSGPVVFITLLLSTTGARHPYKIDEKYLKKRNVNVVGNNPFNVSVYTLKELIWREWREEWEVRPSNPSSIRLIHFGRLLDDKIPLKECRFNADAPNVVHMTVRPQEVVDEEDAKTSKQGMGRDRDGNERSPGCRCVIQ
ncbi:MAG: hypothetical protein M1827_002257 [Pycnora praestabilis]|nr:MAG: hypothetical protein M1827_002257 [Pycnora praestabilis]